MSERPSIIVDPHWRTLSELFSERAIATLRARYELVWAQDKPMPTELFNQTWPDTSVLVTASPEVDAGLLSKAPRLKAIIEVSGAFPDTIDYQACAEQGVEVLSCSPGFNQSVAEMGLAMALGCARGLFTEHEAFRNGKEGWLQDNARTDFTLHGASIGFIGFGQISRELSRLLEPFDCAISAYDPWLNQSVAKAFNIELRDFNEVLKTNRCLFVTASPRKDNRGLLSKEALSMLQDHTVLVLLSRAHLVDFDALTAEVLSGRIRLATDVFPTEPLPDDHPFRKAPNVLLSPHRAAAVKGGRQLIGDMIVEDLNAIFDGRPERFLTSATTLGNELQSATGVGDADQASDMAGARRL